MVYLDQLIKIYQVNYCTNTIFINIFVILSVYLTFKDDVKNQQDFLDLVQHVNKANKISIKMDRKLIYTLLAVPSDIWYYFLIFDTL